MAKIKETPRMRAIRALIATAIRTHNAAEEQRLRAEYRRTEAALHRAEAERLEAQLAAETDRTQ